MSRKNVYFISDLHLGATYEPAALDKERRVVAWLQSIADDAATLYLVGDILDYWYEYRTVVPRGYIRFFGQLAAMADNGVNIVWLIGNHDIWLFDYLKNQICMTVIDGPLVTDIMGKKFYIAHGDGVGHLPRSFRALRAIFRNRFCQTLYAAVHPRWTVRFAHRWSSHSRLADNASPPFKGNDEPLLQFARQYLLDHPDINYFIFGHRHLLVNLSLASQTRFVILGDWLSADSYALFDGASLHLHSLNDVPVTTSL